MGFKCVSSLRYWPYSWLSPHSLILLASCWAFFFSRQALETEEKKSLSFSGTGNSALVFPYMILLLSQLAHTESSWRAMSGGRISKLWGRLSEKPPLHSSKYHLTPRFWKDTVDLVAEFWGLKIKEAGNESISAPQILMRLIGIIICSLQRISYSCSCESGKWNVRTQNTWRPVMLDTILLVCLSACWNVFVPQSLLVWGGCRWLYNNLSVPNHCADGADKVQRTFQHAPQVFKLVIVFPYEPTSCWMQHQCIILKLFLLQIPKYPLNKTWYPLWYITYSCTLI